MTVLVAAWVGAYFVLMLALIVGMRRLPHTRALRDGECPALSVVITARNEADELPACLASLAALDYPAHRLQLVLVDDRSTDATPDLMEAFAAGRDGVVVVHTNDDPPNGLDAKARGIAAGMRVATGEWVLITDADGTVSRAWARHLMSLVGPGVGMVGGAVAAIPRSAVGAIEHVSWTFAQFFSAGAAGLGLPIICVGPNMGIRRDVYVSAGGLERARFRIAEDLALFRMVHAAGLRARMAFDAETLVQMAPVSDARALFSQQRRWLSGGLEQGWIYRVGLTLAFGWGSGVAAFMGFGWLVWARWWMAMWLLRLVVDSAATRVQARRVRAGMSARYFALMESYSVFIFLILPWTLVVRGGVTWRGKGYVVRYARSALLLLMSLGVSRGLAQRTPKPAHPAAPAPASPARLARLARLAPPAPRAVMTRSGDDVVLDVGPIDLPAAGGHEGMAMAMGGHEGMAMPTEMEMPELPPMWAEISVDGWFHGFRVELVDENGAVLTNRLLHHVNVIATNQRELFSPIMLRVAAAGEETPEIPLPRLVGYRAVRGDTLLVRTMFHAAADRSYHGVHVRVHFPFTPSSATIGALRIQPFYLDVTPPQGSHIFDLPPGRSEKHWEARPAARGRVLGVSGHVHKYATRLAFEDVTAHKVLWETKPDTNAQGQTKSMPIVRFLWRLGLPLDPAHAYRLSVTYDNPTGQTIVDGGMGALGGVFLVGRGVQWPAIDPTDPIYREDVRAMSTP